MLGNETLSRAPKTLESEADAYAFLEGLRWGDDGPTQCPHCGSEKGAWYLKPKDPEGRKSKGGSAARSQRRVWKCRENSCRRQFSVLTNTVLHATKMPVRAWIGTVIDLCEDPSGVSARQVAARWEITEKSAWAMLTRIQEALNEPEVAGAQLDSNAPLWFEVAPEVAAVFEEERRARDAAAAEELLLQKQAEQKAAQAIERDVQRALAEAAVGQIAPEVAAETGVKTVFSGVEHVADSRSEGGVEPSISPPDMTPNLGMAEPATDPEGIQPAAPQGTDRSSKRRDPDVENQVKSDVERALAEVFGDALPRQNTSQTQSERPPQPTAERDLSEAVYAPDSGQRPKKTPPDQRAAGEPARPLERAESRASEGGAEPGAAEPKPQNGAGNKRSKAARKKRKQARIAARKRSLETSNERPQPVDNPSDVDGGSAAVDERRTPNRVTRAQARRAEKARSGPTEVPFDEHADLLGGGWLDGPAPEQSRATHVVSSEQGQLHGIAASELGPSWASDSSDVSAETPSKSRPSENQLNIFSDEPNADR